MKRGKFSLSHYKLFSGDMGELIPIGLTEVLPGDTIQHAISALVRVSPLLAPVMHPVHVNIRSYFVPFRLVWDNWEKFITGGPDGMDASVFPTKTINPTTGSLADYLGVPPGTSVEVSALPFRAYALIYNEHFRDQDLQTELVIDKGDGTDTTTSTTMVNVNWERDYFTAARPWTQKGPEVTIPLQGEAPVIGIGKQTGNFPAAGLTYRESDGTSRVYAQSASIDAASSADQTYAAEGTAATGGFPNIRADLSSVTAANINDLRLAFALQRYEEARARYGSRYTEYLRYLGVRSSDARLQRPEYLGGGRQTIQFSEVLQTSPDAAEADTGVGSLKGHGLGAMRSARYRRYFEEHGYVVTLFHVRPRTMYVQGLARTWNRRVKEDFWQRELQHIGQQEILNKELYAAHATPNGVFGYADRYDEYRQQESMVAGDFRSTALDFWHMARIFGSAPVLNSSFVTSNPTKRINAVQTEDVLWVMANHSIQARRLVSARATSFIY